MLLLRTLCFLLVLVAVCSKPNIQSRVIGGGPVDINSNKNNLMASLRKNNQHFCGGSVISNSWILTAAHCVCDDDLITQLINTITGQPIPLLQTIFMLLNNLFNVAQLYSCADLDLQSITAVVGTYYLNNIDNAFSVEEIIRHPRYNPSNFENDVAVVKVDTAAGILTVNPIASLAKNFQAADCARITVTGWGKTQGKNNTLPNALQEASLSNLPIPDCQQRLQSFSASLTDKNVCTFGGGRGSCNGDSGGPLICEKADYTFKIIGIVSWGISGSNGCDVNGYPSVFTSVSYFCTTDDFISSKTNAICT